MISGILIILLRLTKEELLNSAALFMNRPFFFCIPFPRPVEIVVVNQLIRILNPAQEYPTPFTVRTGTKFPLWQLAL